ncbi:cellulose biosynthesis cyclic di-GMP-binding regulatory protein BcsB [Enterobacter asburiae]|nr:cellulose biosynthesis cyclic di-GMP-binding regulatory protein BcsB [Enterobacter asburiae]
MKHLIMLTLLAASLFSTTLRSEDKADVHDGQSAERGHPAISEAAAIPPVMHVISLSQMGQPHGIVLSGGQTESGGHFTLPLNVVVTRARLMLELNVSPEMSARNASMQLMLNGQPLGTVPLSVEKNDVTHFALDIPAALLVTANNFSVKINDNDTMRCPGNLSDQYRVTVLPESRIELEGGLLSMRADLNLFPRPFMDTLQMTPAIITFAFGQHVRDDAIGAAASLSSWFGIEADYRGVSFSVLNDALPDGNGILIGHSGEIIGGFTLPEVDRPTLAIVGNPANPSYRLLLVVGNDDAELRTAVWRLTHGDFPPDTATFSLPVQTLPVSKPYDAPRWIRTDRPVKLKEMLNKDERLRVNGVWHAPLRISFRASPDLFLWDGETLPLHIGYRFPPENWIDEERSWLSMSLNGIFLHNLPVNKPGVLETLWRRAGGDARQESFDMPLEPDMIYGDNELSLYFNITPKANVPCNVQRNNGVVSGIDEDSWIDLSHTRHFTLMPELAYFAGASFPFSRLADYSQTVLLLPERPSEIQIATLLDMAARSGNATGTVMLNNRVILGIPEGGEPLAWLHSRDVLAVSSMTHREFNKKLLSHSPFSQDETMLQVRAPGTREKVQRWLAGEWGSESADADRYLSSREVWRGFVSFRSPWSPGRLVVMVLGSSDDQLSHLHDDLASSGINAAIRGDVAIITPENGIRSFRVGMQFPDGEMPAHLMLIWYASHHPVWLALLGTILSLLTGVAIFACLKKRASRRLEPEMKK